MREIGKPLYFDLAAHVACVESLIKSDEIEMALKLIQMVPAWYQEPGNFPPELTRIRETVFQNLYDASTYGCDSDEASMTREVASEQSRNGYMVPRFDITLQRIKELNADGVTPWVYELGVSHGNLPIGLIDAKARFEYLGRGINWRIVDKVRSWACDVWQDKPAPGQRTIFVCFESLEHMLNEQDLEAGARKVGVQFDEILLSVPWGCLGGGLPNYDSRPLGHVRGYSRASFLAVADRYFPGYKWTMFTSHSIVLHGQKA